MDTNNIATLYIDGKPVRRASLGGKVFYEKHDYELSLVSDMDILSLYDGDIATLTATLTEYGEPVEGETCVFTGALLKAEFGVGTYDVGDNYVLSDFYTQDNSSVLQIGTGTSFVTISGGYIEMFQDQRPIFSDELQEGSFITVKRGVLTYIENSRGIEKDFWLSSYYISELLTVISTLDSVVIESCTIPVITDSNGECSVSYESKGAGDLNIKVEVPRILLQETYALIRVWAPALNGETGAVRTYSYTESNGEAVGKAFLLNHGFLNTDKWELSFEFKHDNIRYTGINFIAEVGVSPVKSPHRLNSWEGSWPNGTRYATYSSGTVGWFDITVTKIDSTHVRLQSSVLNRDTTVEVSWLPDVTCLTCGASHNSASSSYGPCRIRNVRAISIL